MKIFRKIKRRPRLEKHKNKLQKEITTLHLWNKCDLLGAGECGNEKYISSAIQRHDRRKQRIQTLEKRLKVLDRA